VVAVELSSVARDRQSLASGLLEEGGTALARALNSPARSSKVACVSSEEQQKLTLASHGVSSARRVSSTTRTNSVTPSRSDERPFNQAGGGHEVILALQ